MVAPRMGRVSRNFISNIKSTFLYRRAPHGACE